MSCWLRVLIGYRVSIINVVERRKSCWRHVLSNVWDQIDFRAMLLINRTNMLIVVGNALGFFTGSGNVIPFSVDLSDFCRNFRQESNTTIKIYLGYDVLLVNEVHNVIKRNRLFDIRTKIWHKVIFRTQNRMNCKLCRIIRRESGNIVVVHRFLQVVKKVHQWLGSLVAGRSELLLLRMFFKE